MLYLFYYLKIENRKKYVIIHEEIKRKDNHKGEEAMRLRNIPRAEQVIDTHDASIQEEKQYKGKWKEEFQNDHPIRIEIGMGKGNFLLTLAKQTPEVNYIGIEKYSSVLLRAIEKKDTPEFKELTNIRFICMDATDILEVFNKNEVERIYLNFSDPWPKVRHAKRRLTSTQFFARYDQILTQEGTVEFKTDNKELFAFSLEQVAEAGWKLLAHTFDLHHQEDMIQGNVMTEYEEKFAGMGNPICKLIAGR